MITIGKERGLSDLITTFDVSVLEFIQGNLKNDFFDFLLPILTFLGDGLIWLVLSAILLILPKYRHVGFLLILGISMGFLICNLTLKPIIGRLRPYQIHEIFSLRIPPPPGYSFPSGHATSCFAAATILIAYHRKLGIAAFVFAGLVAFSRLYLLVHFPTDVMIGCLLGTGIGFLTRKLAEYMTGSPGGKRSSAD